MIKELQAFRKICKNLNSYEYTDEFKVTKNTIETALKEKEKQDKILQIIKECFVLNGFDELIPNSKWFKSEEKQKLLKEILL